MVDELLDTTELPNWFAYPADFLQVVRSESLDIGPWQILLGKWLRVRNEGLKKRFPDRNLVPFARRLDNDDVACWDRGESGRVYIVHDFSAPGWEQRIEYGSFVAWYQAAREEAKGYDGD